MEDFMSDLQKAHYQLLTVDFPGHDVLMALTDFQGINKQGDYIFHIRSHYWHTREENSFSDILDMFVYWSPLVNLQSFITKNTLYLRYAVKR